MARLGRRLVIACGALLMSLVAAMSAAGAATAPEPIGSSSDDVLVALSASANGADVIAAGVNTDGFAGPNSLYEFTATHGQMTLGEDEYVPAGAVSPDGRYSVWETGPCARVLLHGNTRSSELFVRDDAAGTDAPSLEEALPRGWNRIGVLAISVSDAGRVSLLVSHTTDDNCLGSYSTGPHPTGTQPQGGPDDAILAFDIGSDRRLHVVATDRVGGDTFTSPNGKFYVLCDTGGGHATVYDVAQSRSFVTGGQPVGEDCEVSDSGETFSLQGPGDRVLRVSGRRSSTVKMSPTTGNVDYSLAGSDEATSPGGGAVLLTKDDSGYGDALTESVLLWRPGAGGPRRVAIPRSLRDTDLDAADWLEPNAVLVFPGIPGSDNRVVVLDPSIGRWGAVQRLGGPGLSVEDCALASGHILLAAGEDLPETDAMHDARLYESAGTSIHRIDVGLRAVTGLSCPTPSTVYVSADHALYRFAQPPSADGPGPARRDRSVPVASVRSVRLARMSDAGPRRARPR